MPGAAHQPGRRLAHRGAPPPRDAPARPPLAEAELRRAVRFGEELAADGGPLVVAGDLNLTAASPAVGADAGGFLAGRPGIDHVLVRGAPSTPLVVWPEERRTVNGRVLSDHPPVELEVG